MAIKAALAASLLVALLALAGATTFTTTVTTTTFESNQSQQQKQQCRQHLQGREFRDCQDYLTQSPYLEGQGDIELVTRNPYGPQQQTQSQEKCCNSLRQIEQQQPQCGCEAIKHALQKVQQSGQMGQSPQVYSKAQMLPQLCQMRTQQCQIGVIFV